MTTTETNGLYAIPVPTNAARTEEHREWVQRAVQKYEGSLTLYAARILGNIEHARDAVQETFIRLCMQDRAEVDGHLGEWLYRVCRTRALDARRKESRMAVMTDLQAVTRSSQEPGPPEIAEQKESASQVIRMLDSLPENQREVILLKFQHGLSYKEISRVTNLTVTNIGFLIHTGLKTLRTKMAGS